MKCRDFVKSLAAVPLAPPFEVNLWKRNRMSLVVLLAGLLTICIAKAPGQAMNEVWSSDVSHSTGDHPDDTWFRNAKFR